MISYSIIQKSQLEGSLRVDAEYYQPEYLELDDRIKKFPNHLLKELVVSCFSGKNLPQVACKKDKTKFFIRTQNVRAVLVNKGGITCLDPAITKFPLLKEGDILVVRVGEGVGNTSIVTEEFSGNSFSDNVLRLRMKQVDPYFVIIFLNSRPGYLYWERVGKGSARSLVSSENLDRIRIPDLGEKISAFCKSIILDATKEMQQSESLYLQAENLLLEELLLEDFKIKEDLSYIVNLSEINKFHRADAEYFQPKYEKLISKIKNQNAKLLGDLVLMKKGIEPGAEVYQDEGNLFVRVSSLSKNGIEDKDQKYLNGGLYEKLKKNHEPKIGEILLTKDATPGIAYAIKEPIEGIISSGILRLKLKDKKVEKEYLTLCLNSVLGQMQAERDGGGSVITHWGPEQIKNVLIPVLPKTTQQKIADLVQKSHEARSKAKQLLEQAKHKVEQLIEFKK